MVRTRFLARFAALLAVALQPSALSAQDDDPARWLIGKYCLGCHNDNLLTAGVSFEELDPTNVGTDTAVWEKVLRKVTLGEMPPVGVPAPEVSESAQLVARLEEALDAAAAAAPNPGRPLAHRLNRAEYSNAIRDLLAVDINAGAKVPSVCATRITTSDGPLAVSGVAESTVVRCSPRTPSRRSPSRLMASTISGRMSIRVTS